MLGSLVCCPARGWGWSLLRPPRPTRILRSLHAPLLRPHTFLWGLRGLTRSGQELLYWALLPPQTEGREICHLACVPCASTGLRADGTSPWGAG